MEKQLKSYAGEAEALAAVKKARREADEVLRNMPPELKTTGVCLAAMRYQVKAFAWVPMEIKTGPLGAKICRAVVKREPALLAHVPDELKTETLCLTAVQHGWEALEFVPDRLKAPALCLVAVKSAGKALRFVPEALKTPELCMEAVKAVFQSGPLEDEHDILTLEDNKTFNGLEADTDCLAVYYNDILNYVPPALKTAELCLAAVQANGEALEFVPAVLKTPDMCRLAAREGNEEDFSCIPKRFLNHELCMDAVCKEHSETLRLIPAKLKTPELCLAAVQYNGDMLKFVPEAHKTAELCLAAMLSRHANSSVEKFVPERFKGPKEIRPGRA